MSEFLEQLKLRMADALKRHQTAIAKLQSAQQEHASATQDLVSWQNAVRVETLREQQEAAEAAERQQALPISTATPSTSPNSPTSPTIDVPPAHGEVSKTDAVRQLIRQHPEGIRPTELWKQLGNQLKYRAYLYSILKRLKDRQELREARGKYFLKIIPKPESEEREVANVIQ